jgi:phosphoserine aminotransferase
MENQHRKAGCCTTALDSSGTRSPVARDDRSRMNVLCLERFFRDEAFLKQAAQHGLTQLKGVARSAACAPRSTTPCRWRG